MFRSLLMISGCLMCLFLHAHNLKEADELLKKGNTAQALKLYENILADGKTNVPMYQNMASIYAQNGNVPLSILYLEKALQLDPFNPTIKQQLQEIRQENQLPIEIEESQPIQRFIRSVGQIHFQTWWWSALFLMFLLGIYVIFRYPFQKPKTSEMSVLISALVVIILTSAAGFVQFHGQNRDMILLETYELKISPDDNSPVSAELPGGSKVKKTEQTGEWVRVSDEYGDEGWLPSQLVSPI